ncbi:Oxidoreductase sirO [Lachnellula suecica]|uniref:Oxidoreductase sirO n=1 Tax=Lachnellula suecica TaxID=602035 RepID=A0A8T9C513_9HELO|nr:Oxidoreductase sirO [Lachnellula suecica]
MAQAAPKIVFGTAGIGVLASETQSGLLDILKKHNVKVLDTARFYKDSEMTLKEYEAPKFFEINTKASGFGLGRLSKQSVLDSNKKSLEHLGVDSVDLYYFHSPDPDTPIEESLSAIQELYAAGKFKRVSQFFFHKRSIPNGSWTYNYSMQFGLSNFLAEDVQRIYDIQKAANSVLPTVFQGNYNAVSRHIEEDLFLLLRRLDISFYAYSPIAGGFLVKDSAGIRSKEVEGRFNDQSSSGATYSTIYAKESLLSALDEWGETAEGAGISKAALAYRWISYHSELDPKYGDAVIIGARKTEQLEETLVAIEAGPLDKATAEKAGAIWEKVKAEAPRDNWNSYHSLR